ncbi:MAG: hypothetical protein HND56_12380 [Pseudomonadota bacterium]|nr:hypothetical protein [Pseudomonadota bacterium]QKK06430.1 MAG: hypothetical protein HND56_12380 [Pseudomonadota bacterium]
MPKLRTTFTFWTTLIFLLFVGLQYFPLTGVFLMMVGAPIWTGFFPHLIALAIITDILIRQKFPRFLLVIPLFPYAVYYVFFAVDGLHIKEIERELQSQNPVKIITYNPDKYALIFPQYHARDFVQHYKVPVSYEANSNRPEGYTAYRIITGDLCVQSRGIKEHSHVTSTVSWKEKALFAYKNFTNLCKLEIPESPTKQHLTIRIEGISKESNKSPQKLQKIEYSFYLDEKPIGIFTAAQYVARPRFPKFIIGCALISNPPAWKCVYQLRYKRKVLNTFPKNTDLEKYGTNPIAQMLKIEKYTESDLESFKNYPETEKYLKELIAKKTTPEPCDNPDNEWGCYFNKKPPKTEDNNVE